MTGRVDQDMLIERAGLDRPRPAKRGKAIEAMRCMLS
jgi:hypothetical protein